MSQKNPRHKTKPRALYSQPPPPPAGPINPLQGLVLREESQVRDALPRVRSDDQQVVPTSETQNPELGTRNSALHLVYENPAHGLWLYNDNCLAVLDAIYTKYPEGRFDCIFADPPYFLSNGGITCHAGRMVKVDKGDWDKSQGPELNHEFNRAWLERCQRVLKPNGT
ncbi:MAG TPA: DNA methyltransferase, partial [Verrucomicrobiae bacterium]|nr:DNA methyltransferase [Verrucomicrobiae bacterium]